MEFIKQAAEWCALIIEAVGVVLITGTAVYTLAVAGWQRFSANKENVYEPTRQRLGRGLLLGLGFLVAADIVHTAAVEFTFETVAVLGLIVLIRTVLSFTLEVELTRRWPWQAEKDEEAQTLQRI